MELDDLLNFYHEKQELLDHIGAKTVFNAKRKISSERREFEKTKSQLQEVVNALDVDNWRNAVVRAESLLDKIKHNRMPKWLLTISPSWVDKINPRDYKRWLNFCQEQFLFALSQMELDAEEFGSDWLEEQMEQAKKLYLDSTPARFIELIAEFCTDYDDASGDRETPQGG